MVLKWAGSQHEVALGQLSQPCWTIDLFLFLRECGVEASMFTLVRGFSPENESLAWYGSNMLRADIDRCNEAFALAERRGWEVYNSEKLSMAAISACVSDDDVVALVLVDDNFLKRRVRDCYAGHYVLLIDCDGSDCLYLDPATDPSPKRLSRDLFDTARCSRGTDCDIIFCSRGAKGVPHSLLSLLR